MAEKPTQCCRNPIGFVRANCETLVALVDNKDAILAAAGEGPFQGLTCEQAITCINNAILNEEITNTNINAVSGTYDPCSGDFIIGLSNGSDFNVVGFEPKIEPVELNPGGAFPTPVELQAAANTHPEGTIVFYGGDTNSPDYAWLISCENDYTLIESPTGAPRVLQGDGAPAGNPSVIDPEAQDDVPSAYWDRDNDRNWHWNTVTQAWEAEPLPPVDQPRVLTGDSDPASIGAPSVIDVNADDANPAIFWDRTLANNPRLWAWNTTTAQWEPANCCPDCPIEIPFLAGAFGNPAQPTDSEAAIWIAANGNGIPGQLYWYYDTFDAGGATIDEATHIWYDGDGVGSVNCIARILTPPPPPVEQPFQLEGVLESSNTEDPVPGDVDIYRTGAILIGGADASPAHSVGLFGVANDVPQFEVIGTTALGAGNHTVTGDNATVISGAGNEASGENSVACGSATDATGDNSFSSGTSSIASGLNAFAAGGVNQATATHSASVGGSLNIASGAHSFVGGGLSCEAQTFETAIVGGRNIVSAAQYSLATGRDHIIGVAHGSFICGQANTVISPDCIVGGGTNDNSGNANVVSGNLNVVTALADSGIYAGSGNNWDGPHNIAAGTDNNISGGGNIVAGDTNVGGGTNAIICGTSNTPTNLDDGIISGSGNTSLNASRSLVVGQNNDLDAAVDSIVGGLGNDVFARYSIVSGSNNVVGVTGGPVNDNLLIVGSGISVADGVLNSVALGVGPVLQNQNNFIFSAHSATATASANAFTVHGDGGARFFTDTAGTVGAELLPSATAWTAISLREKKTNIVQVQSALDKISRLGVYKYSYKDENGDPAKLLKQGVSRVVKKKDLRAESAERFLEENPNPPIEPESFNEPEPILSGETREEIQEWNRLHGAWEARKKSSERSLRRYERDLKEWNSNTRPKARPDDEDTVEIRGWVDSGKNFEQMGPMADGDDGWSAVVGTGPDYAISSHDMAALALAGLKEAIAEIQSLKDRVSALEAAQ